MDENPPTDDIASVVAALLAGGCVGIPTDTVYGVACRLDDPAAIEALFDLKGRSATKAMAVLVGDVDSARALARFDDVASAIADKFWPGPLTMVLRRAAGLNADLGGDASTIGVRCPAFGLVREITQAVGPIVTTSANLAGRPTLETAIEIVDAFGDRLAVVFDGGRLAQAASTVVDLTADEPIVLREGPITAAQLRNLS